MNNRFIPNAIGRTGSLCLILLLVTAAPSVLAQRVSLDKIIAIVDEDVVLQSELDERMAEYRQRAQQSNTPLPPPAEFRKQALDTLVLENIQLQLAKRVSVRFSDDILNRVMADMAAQNNMSFDEYVQILVDNNAYISTREQIRKELTLREVQRGMVNRRISITNQEIENFLNSGMGRSTLAAEYLVDHMLIAIAEGEASESVESKLRYATDLVARLNEGADFVQIRAQAQRGPFSVTGTNFDWRKVAQIPSLFTDVVPTMEIGAVAGPIRAGNGFHIIKLMNIRGGTNRMVDQSHVRHILIAPNEIRTEEQALSLITDLRNRILAGQEFATLARQNSNDPSSVVAGGDLSWVDNFGAMAPTVERVVNSLAIGEISEPVRSPEGWHIVEVLDRRRHDASIEYGRAQAENVLRGRKFDLELENWLLEIREEAFVEYKE
jgi:peptidyl-prolyl cis-trans isomerase SurA